MRDHRHRSQRGPHEVTLDDGGMGATRCDAVTDALDGHAGGLEVEVQLLVGGGGHGEDDPVGRAFDVGARRMVQQRERLADLAQRPGKSGEKKTKK